MTNGDSAANVEGPDEAAIKATFEQAPSFTGARAGFVFKLGASGLGYYREGAEGAEGQSQSNALCERMPDDAHLTTSARLRRLQR